MDNTREKLIELLKLSNACLCDLCGEAGRSDIVAGVIAENLIAHGVTVQEQDGCEYCKADNDGFRRMFGAFSLVNPFNGKGWQIHAGKCKPREIHYCPMCGRKLSEPPKGD